MQSSTRIAIEPLLTFREAADALGLKYWAVLRAANSKLFPTYTFLNGRRYVRVSEILEIIERSSGSTVPALDPTLSDHSAEGLEGPNNAAKLASEPSPSMPPQSTIGPVVCNTRKKMKSREAHSGNLPLHIGSGK